MTHPSLDLKRQQKAIDLALAASRKRQSPRTGFVHFFSSDETVSDTIPIFENFCFIFTLFRQKTAEAILEGKELIDRLLSFQLPSGNFPIYLHDYPKTWDPFMGLRVAPILVQILRHFGSVLNVEMKEKIERALAKIIELAQGLSLPPLWQHRYLRLINESSSFSPVSAEEWFESLISDQLISTPTTEIPFHQGLQVFTGDSVPQEKGEPRPAVIEWLLSESEGFSSRLKKDHSHQMYTSLLFPWNQNHPQQEAPFVFTPQKSGGLRLLWEGNSLHSLTIPFGTRVGNKVIFDLNAPLQVSRHDVFEALVFCDISSETEVLIEGKKGTVFQLGDKISIITPRLQIEVVFTLIEGEGDFCGQISRGNRPSQTACQKALLYEVFDWQIGLRTLRRDAYCKIQVELLTHLTHTGSLLGCLKASKIQ